MFKKLPCEEIYDPEFNRIIIIVSKDIMDAYEEYIRKNNSLLIMPKIYFDVKLSRECMERNTICYIRRLYNPKEDSTLFCAFGQKVYTDDDYKDKYLKAVDFDFIKFAASYNPDTVQDTGIEFKNHLLEGNAGYSNNTQEIIITIDLNNINNKSFDVQNMKYNKEYFMKRNYRETLNLFDKVSYLKDEKNMKY